MSAWCLKLPTNLYFERNGLTELRSWEFESGSNGDDAAGLALTPVAVQHRRTAGAAALRPSVLCNSPHLS